MGYGLPPGTRFCCNICSDTTIFYEGWRLKTLKDFGGQALAAADGVAFVPRRASRAGGPGWFACGLDSCFWWLALDQ
jgi:hypothetical protein